MARLLDCFSALFAFARELDASSSRGEAGNGGNGGNGGDPEAAQRRARALLEQARAAAAADGLPAAQIESASFAMVAWLDEILARSPGWRDGMVPLQAQLFNSNNAHSEFFHHLAALKKQDDPVREVYWQVLLHGFKGQYYFEEDDRGELGKLKKLHGHQLALGPDAPRTAAGSEPRRRRSARQPAASIWGGAPAAAGAPRRRRALLQMGLAFALLLPLLYLLWVLPASPLDAEPTLAQRVELQLQRYACADLAAEVGERGRTHVSGFVSVRDDIARVEREIGAIAGVASASFDLRLRAWPYCEVVAILKPYQARNRSKPHGLQVQALGASRGRLREGEAVRVQVAAPDHPAHLRVDYFTADGAVLHLHAGRGQAPLRAGEKIELASDIPSSWLIGPPFGHVLVTALSSPLPFNETAELPPFELTSAYLLRLREALAANKGGERLIADFVFLETVER